MHPGEPAGPAGPPPIPEDDDLRGDLIVIGGGCYGCYHAGQLDKARSRGRIDPRAIVIVDRDPDCRARSEFAGRPGFRFVTATWDAFYDAYFDARTEATRDRIVPTPIAPHLVYEWLRRRAARTLGGERVRKVALTALPDTPFARLSGGGAGLLSFATWICPVNCIEPALCPETRGPRDWEMEEAVYAFARREAGAGRPFDLVEVFRTRHYAWGVAAFPAARAAATARRMGDLLLRLAGGAKEGREAAGSRHAEGGGVAAARVLVATVSSCHGVMNRMDLGAILPAC